VNINPASESNTAVTQGRVVQYSELDLAHPLVWIKNTVIVWASETDEAQRQARIMQYSEVSKAMSLTFHFEPATPVEPEIDVTLGGSRPVGTYGPILGSEFEIEIPAHIAFIREFTVDVPVRRIPAVPAVLQFTSEVDGRAQFNRVVQFSLPGTRLIPLHYSQVLREDRELIELIESGVL
jgi:hypothetical protein